MVPRLFTRAIAIASACLIAGGGVAFAKKKKDPVDKPEVQDMVVKLANQPDLLCLQYLHLVIGNPDNLATATAWMNPHKHYIWYQKGKDGVKFELFQEEPNPGTISQAKFVAHLTDLKLTLPKVEGKFGEDAKKYYDQESSPTEEYSFAPYTALKFSQPHKSLRVKTIIVDYNGPGLAEASPDEIASATLDRKQQALAHLDKQNYSASLPLLLEHIKENPSDMEAQVALAKVYANQCNINDAINQYKFVLANGASDPQAMQAAQQGLEDLKVMPTVAADSQELHHNYQLKEKGEGFKVGDVKDKNGDPLVTNPPAPAAPQDLLPNYPGGIYAQTPPSGQGALGSSNAFGASNALGASKSLDGSNPLGMNNAPVTPMAANMGAPLSATMGAPISSSGMPLSGTGGGSTPSQSRMGALGVPVSNAAPVIDQATGRRINFSTNPSAPLDLSSLDPDF